MDCLKVVWNDINVDFDPEEETANFGTRHALEADGNLYEVCSLGLNMYLISLYIQVVTFATIEPNGVVEAIPRIYASASNLNCVVAIDNCLDIFSSNCSEAIPLLFPHDVNTFAFSPCSRFLVAGLQNGSMQFIYLPFKKVLSGQILTQQSANHDVPTFTSSFFIGDSTKASMSLVAHSGQIFSFECVELDFFHHSLSSGDLDSLKGAQERIVSKKIETSIDNIHNCILSRDCYLVANQVGITRIMFDNDNINEEDILEIENCLKMVVSNNDPTTIFCLDKAGQLQIMCPSTLTVLHTWQPPTRDLIEDFVLWEDEGSSDSKMLMIVKNKANELFFQIVDFPSFTVSYRLAVSWYSKLVVPPLNQETPMLIEGASDDVLRPDVVNRMRIRGISEGVPEARLGRLLKRNKFDEAEKFAKDFGLEKENIYRSKASWILGYLSPWKPEDPTRPHTILFNDLKHTLGLMTDLEFVVELCATAAFPNLGMTRNFLLFARNKIENNVESVSEELMLRVGNTLHRLETFSLIHSEEDKSNLIDLWMDFTRASMLIELEQSLSCGDLNKSLLLWIRHQAEFKVSLDVDKIADLLYCIPENQSCDSILRWLRQFIPDSLNIVPGCLPVMATWAVDTVKRLELLKKKLWPSIGLEFAQSVLDTMTFSKDGESSASDFNQFMTLLTLNQQRAEQESPLTHLIQLINSLKDLLILHKQYRIKLKLAEFLDSVKFNVISLILDWVNLSSEIAPLMENFLGAFMLRCDLEVNKTLSEYITNLLDNTNFTWHWHIGAAPWEEKVASLLHYITSVEDKSEVILEAVKNAPVPWSKTILSICDTGCSLQHHNSVLIKEQASLVNVKTILRKYDCKSYATSGREAERLLQFLLKKGGEEGYRDALEVNKVIGVKSEHEMLELYLEHLIRDTLDSVSAVKQIQKIMIESPCDKGIKICEHIVDTAWFLIKYELGDPVESAYIEVLKGILGIFSVTKEDKSCHMTEIEQKAETLYRAFHLKKEFNLKTKETDLNGDSFSINCMQASRGLLSQYINSEIFAMKNRDDVDENLRHLYVKLKRFCDLTLLDHEEAVGRLVLHLATESMYQPALLVANMLMEASVTPELAENIFSVIYRLEGELSRGEDNEVEQLISVLDRMARQALTYCSDSSLVDCLELFSWQNLNSRIQKESHSRKTFQAGQMTNDAFKEWRFSLMFRDKGLPLERSSVLPLSNRCMTSVLPVVDNPPLPYLPRHQAAAIGLQDLNVTAPDVKALENGVDAQLITTTLAQNGQQLVSHLQQAGHYMLGFSALQTTVSPMSTLLLSGEPNVQEEIEVAVNGKRSQLIVQIIQRILGEGKCDLDLGLGFIMAESKRNSLALLAKINNSFGLDYRKISSLALLGIEYCRLNGLAKQEEQFKDLYVRSCWGKKAAELDINFKSAFNGSKTVRINVLQEMVSHPEVDIQLILQFSKAFDINSNDALTRYIEGLLLGLEPIVNDRGEFVLKQFTAVTEKVDEAWNLIEDDEILYQHLVKLFSAVSPYNYTVLRYLLFKIYQTRTYKDDPPQYLQNADKVLGFLSQYERVSEPHAEWEVDKWVKERGCPFPSIAIKRLPLLSLILLSSKDKYKLLELEFNLDTYQSWIQVSKVLGIATDNICYFSVKNTVAAMLEKNAKDGHTPTLGSGEWLLGHVNKNVLENIKLCISSMTSVKKAAAASNWVVNRLPKGADKVLASVGAELTLKSWCSREEGSKEALVGLEHSRKIRKQLETEQVLHKHGIAFPQYIETVYQNKPIDLIFRLFEDPSIEERNKVAAGQYPDLNSAAKAIADINGLNLTSIKYEMLDKWLPLANSCSSPNDSLGDFTLDLGVNTSSVEGSSNDEINFLRCVYLLQDSGENNGLEYLLKYAFSSDSMVSTSHKLRALKCLFSICSNEELEKVTGRTVTVVQQHMRTLVYLARLESLNLPYTQQSLESCSKESLVEGIWRTYKHSPEGITLVRDLCIEYQIWSTQLWTAVLDQLCSQTMLKELENTLIVLNSEPHLWNSPQFLSAWNMVLLSPFKSLVPPINHDKAEKCRRAMKLLHFCPIAGDLDLETLTKECMRVKMFELAAMVLPYFEVNSDVSQSIKEELEKHIQFKEVKLKLNKLKDDGFLTLSNMNSMLTETETKPSVFSSPAL